jgi:4-amino-4-deoxy-L-arabinose transferase-like glycosyltransferase
MRDVALLAAIAAVMFFVNLGGAPLWDEDEAIFSQTAREMLERSDLVVPYFNGEVFVHKPPLMYWLRAGAYELFGTTEFAARFFSAVFGVGSVLVTYRLGRLVFSPAVGFWSGLILASNLNFNIIARAATPDSFLVFFSTLAVLIFVSGTAKARAVSSDASERNAPWVGQRAFNPSWPTYALAYAAMGLGVLTKGPIGVVLPTAVIGLFLLVMRAAPGRAVSGSGWRRWLQSVLDATARVLAPRHLLVTVWSMRPLTALAVVLTVAGPWYAVVGTRTDGEFLAGFFGVHNFGRFLNAMENHRGPIFYYLIAMAAGFFPWSVLFGPTLIDIARELRRRSPWQPGYVLVGSWVVVWVGFFSLAGTKLPSYIVPAYPALALATGTLVDRWLREPSTVTLAWSRAVWGTVALVGVGLAIGLPVAAHLFLADDWKLGAIGALPLVGALVGWYFSEQGRVLASVSTLATLSVVLAVAMFGWGASYVARYRDTPHFAHSISASTLPGEEPAVGSFHYFRPSFVFYTGRPVAQLGAADDVATFFNSHRGGAFLLTTDERYESIRSTLPSDVTVIDTQRRFLRPGQAVLLGRVPRPGNTALKPADGSLPGFQ